MRRRTVSNLKLRGVRWLKLRRVIDSLVVLVAAPLLTVLAASAAALVFLEDRHSPFIRLTRSGRHGGELAVTKIRSMRPGGGPSITSSEDDRVTRVGHVLRAVRLDEIPQTLQVLTGEMALIGPRPESPDFVDLDDPKWQSVLSVRPAIAGLSQVIAGPWESTCLTDDDSEERYRSTALPAKLAMDGWYVENASPLVDLKIVISIAQMMITRSESTMVHRIVASEIPAAKTLLSAPGIGSGP